MGEVGNRFSVRLAARLTAWALAILVTSAAASSQPYPNRVIRIVHGFAAGGAADTLSRIMAEGLSGPPVNGRIERTGWCRPAVALNATFAAAMKGPPFPSSRVSGVGLP